MATPAPLSKVLSASAGLGLQVDLVAGLPELAREAAEALGHAAHQVCRTRTRPAATSR
ncbi:MAG: hypothetical protein INH41_02460 [Myxococcaceae bacterium]|jgi:hypothetical protein|nr:hypothetical protein [Myxococcaceae bacterium]MCA3011242.1 hypothetical protein [Myxococcaceae bacterium]